MCHYVEVDADGRVFVKDLDSLNGTSVEGRDIRPGVQVELKPGMQVTLGDQHLVWRCRLTSG